MNQVPDVKLNDGKTIPQFGFGVFKVDPAQTAEAVAAALQAGYRHIDTAQAYGNESGVGQAVAESGLDRGDVFVTSKLHNGAHLPDDARKAFDGTLAELGFDYLDLFLIHWPAPALHDGDFVSTWRALEEFQREGRVRSIGVSNFQVHHLQRILDECDTVPAVNQIEVHPYLTQVEVRAFCADHGVAVEAWSPIARGLVVDDPAINAIATSLGRTAVQVVLRWHIQRGDIVIPKTVSPQRMRENIDVFSFELGPEAMEAISALNRGHRTGPDPDQHNFVPEPTQP